MLVSLASLHAFVIFLGLILVDFESELLIHEIRMELLQLVVSFRVVNVLHQAFSVLLEIFVPGVVLRVYIHKFFDRRESVFACLVTQIFLEILVEVVFQFVLVKLTSKLSHSEVVFKG